MQRRQETQRLLAGRNEANPLEFTSAFRLGSTAPQQVGGVQEARPQRGSAGLDETQRFLDGLSEFGSSHIREAAQTRYERRMMEGAMARTQGQAISDLPQGDVWTLEGYRTMDAEVMSSQLFAAQQQEISAGLHESDPETFRARYTQRLENVLQGRDERTQQLISQRMLEQMPQLVAQHTREHANYLEGQTYNSLANTVAELSADPANTDQLLSFARGESGSAGLSQARRTDAVVEGVVRAYSSDNPLAYALLNAEGAMPEMSPEQQGRVRAAQQQYEQRRRTEYNEDFFRARTQLMDDIANGQYTDPHDAVARWSTILSNHGITMNYQDAAGVYVQSEQAGAAHYRATNLELETARINGDYGEIARITSAYAQSATRPTNASEAEHRVVQSFVAEGMPLHVAQGIAANIVVESGTRTDINEISPVVPGSRGGFGYNQWTGPRRRAIESAAQARGVNLADHDFQISYTMEELRTTERRAYDALMQTSTAEEAAQVYSDMFLRPGIPNTGARIRAARRLSSTNTDMGDFDTQHWQTLIEHFEGDVEAASVAYVQGHELAEAWVNNERDPEMLNQDTATFLRRVTGEMSGERYVTASTREAFAREAYNTAREAAAVDVYARMMPQLQQLDQQYLSGQIGSQQDWQAERERIRAAFGVDQTMAEVDHQLRTISQRSNILAEQAKESNDEDYARRVADYNIERDSLEQGFETSLEQILNEPTPSGMSEVDALRWRQDQIEQLGQDYYTAVNTSASNHGIEFAQSSYERIVTQANRELAQALRDNLDRSQERVARERAISEGRLNTVPQASAEQAFQEFTQTGLADAATRARSEWNLQGGEQGTGQTEADYVTDAVQQATQEWMGQANYVPEEMRNAHSAAVRGRLIDNSGDVNPAALSAILSYRDMRRTNPVTAQQMLDPDARVTADVALALSNGNEQSLPRVMADLWEQGLSSPFTRQPDPDFASRPDVQAALNREFGGGRLRQTWNRLIGAEPGLQQMNLSPENQEITRGLLSTRIQQLHELQPRINPAQLVTVATNDLMNSVVPMRGSLLVSPDLGDNLYEQIFGGMASEYSHDRSSAETAIHDYLQSDVFRQRHEVAPPSVGIVGAVQGALQEGPFRNLLGDRDAQVALGNRMLGRVQYDVTAIGNGRISVSFVMDDQGNRVTRIVPLEEIGSWYMQNDRMSVTGR